MKMKIKYFGLVAEAVGRGQEELEYVGTDATDLRAFFIAHYPQLAGLSWKIAVDQEFVEGPIALHDHAEVVLLPPFAGG
jgi:sulfur-carrier protein